MDDPAFESNVDVATQEILLASSDHDIAKLRSLLRNTDANARDPETGYTPLHAAIASCEEEEEEEEEDNVRLNGDQVGNHTGPESANSSQREQLLSVAAETVRFLFQHGATWNDVDSEGETPGCMALRLGLKEIYAIIVDQGVRSELLATRLDQYEVLLDEDVEDQGPETAVDQDGADVQSAADEMNDAVADAVRQFEPDVNVFADDEEFMRTIVAKTVELVLPQPRLRVLTVEPDTALIHGLESRQPAIHHLIVGRSSNDPDIAAQSPESRWDFEMDLFKQSGSLKPSTFDAVIFGNASASYQQFRKFVSHWAEWLLDLNGGPGGDGGLMSFFHAFGAHRQVEYDVYTKLLEMDLFEAGFDTEWTEIPVGDGARRETSMPSAYRLPVCRLVD